jgi:hypothetical protein
MKSDQKESILQKVAEKRETLRNWRTFCRTTVEYSKVGRRITLRSNNIIIIIKLKIFDHICWVKESVGIVNDLM